MAAIDGVDTGQLSVNLKGSWYPVASVVAPGRVLHKHLPANHNLHVEKPPDTNHGLAGGTL